MKTINTTEKEFARINALIKKIRITREEWCELIDNENLKKNNTYEKYSDIEIIIDALNGLLCEEEWEVHDLIEKEKEKNDKAD